MAQHGAPFPSKMWGRNKGTKDGAMTIRSLNNLRPGDAETLGDGSHSDGGGLYLGVRDGGRLRSWIFRFTSPVTGKVREMGFGKAGRGGVDLKAARARRDELRALLDQGLDPLSERKKRAVEQAAKKTFAEVEKLALAKKLGGWKGGERSTSYAAWVRTIKEAKALHQRPVDEIGLEEVKRVVAAKWDRGFHHEARMALARIATVFDYARAHGWRSADNPAAWTIFKHIAPDRPKAAKHHPSVDWRAAPAIMARLRESASMTALALEFTILTGARISEALKAEWREVDLERAIWTIPPGHMKRELPHAVPLSDRASAILAALHARRGGSHLVFPGKRPGASLSRATALELSHRVSDGKACCHGWRSTLRSWMADHSVPFEVAEAALAHSSAAVVASYQRSALTELRRPIMEKWASYLSGQEPAAAEVIPLARRA
jgi:integrase